MYFDLAPKATRKDLYNFENELKELYRSFEHSRLVLILGPRRIGKTSILLTALNESRLPYILLDARRAITLEGSMNIKGFMRALGEALEKFFAEKSSIIGDLLQALKKIKGITISAGAVSLAWGKSERPNLASIIDSLNTWAKKKGTKVILAIDEAQELRFLVPFKLQYLFAHIYDYMNNVIIVLTGSQVGLLYDFLRIEDARAPLYGRARTEIRLKNLDTASSLDFLKKGFKQAKVKPSSELLERAVEQFDGIIGWLTYFGWSAALRKVDSFEDILKEASKLALEEVKNFLKGREQAKTRYTTMLKALSRESLRWNELKKALEAVEGFEIDGSSFTDLLSNLLKVGFVEKKGELYTLTDPLLSYALRFLR